MIGKIWSIAQESGKDWNNEKLQKYLSGNKLDNCRSSSGACLLRLMEKFISRAMEKYNSSTCARVFKSSNPKLNRSSDSSRICCASCHASSIRGGVSVSQME